MAESPEGEDGFSAEYIEGFYNTRRRHSALGHLTAVLIMVDPAAGSQRGRTSQLRLRA